MSKFRFVMVGVGGQRLVAEVAVLLAHRVAGVRSMNASLDGAHCRIEIDAELHDASEALLVSKRLFRIVGVVSLEYVLVDDARRAHAYFG